MKEREPNKRLRMWISTASGWTTSDCIICVHVPVGFVHPDDPWIRFLEVFNFFFFSQRLSQKRVQLCSKGFLCINWTFSVLYGVEKKRLWLQWHQGASIWMKVFLILQILSINIFNDLQYLHIFSSNKTMKVLLVFQINVILCVRKCVLINDVQFLCFIWQ